MKTPNPDHPIRNTLKHLALASAMGAAMFLGASPASAVDELNASTYLGSPDASLLDPIANLIALTPDATGTTTATIDFHGGTWALPGSPSGDDFSVLWEGWFDVTKDGQGVYTFGTSSDDGSVVYLDLNNDGDFADSGERIVNNNNFQGDTAATGQVDLQMNSVRMVIGYYQGGGGYDMRAAFKKGTGLGFGNLDLINSSTGYFFTEDPYASLTVGLISPSNADAFISGSSVTASAFVTDPGAFTHTVTFNVTPTSPPGATFPVVSTDTSSPYTADLGTLADGTYEIYATVVNSNSTPETADSATRTFTVAPPVTTTTTLVSSGSPSTYGDSVTFTATVGPVAPSGGTVQFYNDNVPLGNPVAVDTTTGEASVTTSTLGVVAPNEITADYLGFQIYDPSTTAASITQVVNKAVLTVTAQNESRFLNTANPTLTAQFTGFQNGETLGTSGVDGAPALSTAADEASPIGTYDIICGEGDLAADNYSFTFVNATLSVVPVTSLAINVNLDRTVRPGLEGPVGGLGETWNTISTTSASNLRVASGPASTVGFSSSGTGSWSNPGESANFDPTLVMLKEGSTNFSATGTTQQLVITDLDSAKTYDLYIASAILITTNQRNRGEWSTPNTTSTVGSQVSDNTDDVSDPENPINQQNSTTWERGNNYVLFEDVVPDGSGNITVNGFAITGAPYDIRLALNGFQLVESAPVTGGFDTWADANGATDQTPEQDHDFDGVENGIEYFMGETGSSFTATPGLDENNMISWMADPAYLGTYEVQTSPDLATWTNVDPRPTPSGGFLTYELPAGAPGGKSFVRLLVTPTP